MSHQLVQKLWNYGSILRGMHGPVCPVLVLTLLWSLTSNVLPASPNTQTVAKTTKGVSKIRRILYNLDGDSCMTLVAGRKGPGPLTTAHLTNLVAELTTHGSQVDTLLVCVNAQISQIGNPAISRRAEPRFVQDRFGIGFWVSPQTDERVEERWAEIAEANFTFVIGLCGGKSPMPVEQQLQLCEKHGLKALVPAGDLNPKALPDSPAVWGYSVVDEPNAREFPNLRKTVDELRRLRPGKLAYINLFPDYATAAQLGNATYAEHVSSFMEIVKPDVLSMDHYPIFRADKDGRDNYCRNLEVMRRESVLAGIPFWNFFNTMPYGPHTDPTEAQLRWQIFTSLAYGAKGVMYFCYWTPRGDEFPKGGAILTADGRRTRHYEEAKRINAGLKNLGPTLMRLSSTGVTRVKPKTNAADALKTSALRSLSEGDFLVGDFRLPDGRRAVLLNNYEFAYSAWPTVAFDVDASRVLEVSPKSGLAAPVLDDSPDMPGLQISLDAGEGRLFLLPPQ